MSNTSISNNNKTSYNNTSNLHKHSSQLDYDKVIKKIQQLKQEFSVAQSKHDTTQMSLKLDNIKQLSKFISQQIPQRHNLRALADELQFGIQEKSQQLNNFNRISNTPIDPAYKDPNTTKLEKQTLMLKDQVCQSFHGDYSILKASNTKNTLAEKTTAIENLTQSMYMYMKIHGLSLPLLTDRSASYLYNAKNQEHMILNMIGSGQHFTFLKQAGISYDGITKTVENTFSHIVILIKNKIKNGQKLDPFLQEIQLALNITDKTHYSHTHKIFSSLGLTDYIMNKSLYAKTINPKKMEPDYKKPELDFKLKDVKELSNYLIMMIISRLGGRLTSAQISALFATHDSKKVSEIIGKPFDQVLSDIGFQVIYTNNPRMSTVMKSTSAHDRRQMTQLNQSFFGKGNEMGGIRLVNKNSSIQKNAQKYLVNFAKIHHTEADVLKHSTDSRSTVEETFAKYLEEAGGGYSSNISDTLKVLDGLKDTKGPDPIIISENDLEKMNRSGDDIKVLLDILKSLIKEYEKQFSSVARGIA